VTARWLASGGEGCGNEAWSWLDVRPSLKSEACCELVRQAPAGFKVNQEVNITVRPVFTAHSRPNHPPLRTPWLGAKAQNIFPASMTMTMGARSLAEAFLCGYLCKCLILLHQITKQAANDE
jgi:hypothetical protein